MGPNERIVKKSPLAPGAFGEYSCPKGGAMPKTLVVDDDPATEAMFRDVLRKREVKKEFLFASSDSEALKLLQDSEELDVVIIAVDSEKLSGLKLLQKLDAKDARLPRIALTGKPDLEQLRQALQEGASDFLVKPVKADDLRPMLARVYRECERRRLIWRNENELSAIRREIEIAGEIQRRILPSRFPVRDGLDIFARTLQASEIGGDFYDVFELPSGSLGLVIADVSGKGVPAAFFMAVARTLIRATALHEHSPGACLQQVNQLLCRHEVPGMFVTTFYGVLDTKKWKLTYANGGHPPPLLVSAVDEGGEGLIEPLEGGEGTVLGVEETQTYEEGSIVLDAGDGVFCYTDGLTEALDFENIPFGEEQLWRVLAGHASGSASDLAGAVAAAIQSFVGNAPQHDDITNLVFKRAG